jgi:primosomal protein N'
MIAWGAGVLLPSKKGGEVHRDPHWRRANPNLVALRALAELANKSETRLDARMDSVTADAASPAYLARLNDAQRSAVLHGAGLPAGPLLIIAGAGSGKTSALAHRVAHLLVEGADPRRILLMTFSRRAAAEMTRRVEHIAGELLGDKAAVMTQGLTWAGTFHAIGARLLRDTQARSVWTRLSRSTIAAIPKTS